MFITKYSISLNVKEELHAEDEINANCSNGVATILLSHVTLFSRIILKKVEERNFFNILFILIL